MPHSNLTETVIVALIDGAGPAGRDRGNSADLRTVMKLLNDRASATNTARSVLGSFTADATDAAAQEDFRRWLLRELNDQAFRDSLQQALGPVLARYRTRAAGGAPDQSNGRARSIGRRQGSQTRDGSISRPLVVVGLLAVVYVVIQLTGGLGGSSHSNTTVAGDQGAPVVQSSESGSGPASSAPAATFPSDLTPVASFSVSGPSSPTAQMRGTVLLGPAIKASSAIGRQTLDTPPCSTLDAVRSLALPFEMKMSLAKESTAGQVTLQVDVAGLANSSIPPGNDAPVLILSGNAGTQCSSGSAPGGEERFFMGADSTAETTGWILFPHAVTSSGATDDLRTLAAYGLSISVTLPDSGDDLVMNGRKACRGNLVQISGVPSEQDCGTSPTPTPTVS